MQLRAKSIPITKISSRLEACLRDNIFLKISQNSKIFDVFKRKHQNSHFIYLSEFKGK